MKKRIIRVENGIIEYLGEGQQFVCAGDHPSTARYEWVGGLPDILPHLEQDQLEAIWLALGSFRVQREQAERHDSTDVPYLSESIRDSIEPSEAEDLVDALQWGPLRAAAADNSCWNEVGYALLSLGEVGRQLWLTFSEFAAGYEPGAPDTWWDQHITQIPRSDFRHIFTMARRMGWRAATLADTATFDPAPEPSPNNLDLIGEDDKSLAGDSSKMGDVPDPKYLTTDLANARRMRRMFDGDLIADSTGRFLLWCGTHWEYDETIANRYSLRLSSVIGEEIDAYRDKIKGILEDSGEELRALYIQAKNATNKTTSAKLAKLKEDKIGERLWQMYELIAKLRKWQKVCEMEYAQTAAVRELRRGLQGDDSIRR